MKAITYERYGGPEVLELREVDRPEPADDEVLIRVRGSSVNPYDWHFMTGLPLVMRLQLGGLRRPKYHRLGVDVAGEVEAVGAGVARFSAGDAVFGMVNGGTDDEPELAFGAHAEYVCVSERWLEPKPSSLTFEEAGVVPTAAITAYQGLHHIAAVQPGQQVLVNGASGGVGTFAVQIAAAAGAEVTGVCSTVNVDMVRSLGAAHVVDYMRDDFADEDASDRYDVVLDNVGSRSLTDVRRVLRPGGMYLASFGQPEHRWFGPFGFLVRMFVTAKVRKERLVSLDQHRNEHDLADLVKLVEAGRLRPVIDRTHPLAEVPEAMRYLARGHARAKIAITV